MAKQVEVLEIQFDTKSATDNAVELNRAIEKLNDRQKVLKATTGTTSREYQKNQEILKANKTELNQLNKSINDNTRAQKAQTGSIEQQRARLAVLNKQWREQGTATEAGRKRQAALGKEVRKLTADLKKQESAVGDNRRNVGNYTQSINQSGAVLAQRFAPAVAGATTGLLALTQAAIAFIATPIGAIIAAIGVAVGAVATAFTRSQGAIETFRLGFAQVTATVDVLIDRFSQVGQGIIALFSGDITGGIEQLTTAFDNLGEEIEQEVAITRELEQALIDLEKAENNNIVTSAVRQAQIADLRLQAKDRSIGTQEQIRLLNEARDITEDLFKTESDLKLGRVAQILGLTDLSQAQEIVNATIEDANSLQIEQIGLAESTEEDRKEALELIAQLVQLQKTEADQLRTIESERQGLILRRQKEIEKTAAAEQKAFEERRERNQLFLDELNALIDTTTGLEDRQAELRKERNEELKEQLKEITETTQDEAEKQIEIDAQVQTAKLAAAQNLARQVEKLADENTALAKAAGVASVIVSTYQGAAAALAPPPLGAGPVFGPALAAVTVATGLQNVGKILSAAAGDMWTFGEGGKSGIFGGKPHSSGGTKGVFEDGTRVEVEKDEAFIVVNKRDTPLLSMLNDINSIHGKSFMRDGGELFFQDGGAASRFAGEAVNTTIETANSLRTILDQIPNPVVFVEDIRTGVGNQVQVENRASA